MLKSIVSDLYHSGIVESRVFAAEDVAEGIAYEVSVANHQVGTMVGVTVNPCGDSTVGYVVAEFSCICSVQYVTGMPLFEC